MLDSFERILRKIWWLLLVLYIIFAAYLLKSGYGCYFNTSKDNKIDKPVSEWTDREVNEAYLRIIPKEPRRRSPINEEDIIRDPDFGANVLSNVVNIALKDLQGDFERYVVELRTQFSGDLYEIIYYDDETTRVQLRFPEEERESIKNAIRSRLPAYDLLIWDEAIFGSARIFNDPVLIDERYNWHFKAINSEKAWDITAGDTSIIIAVIDDGFDLDHEELTMKSVHRYNVVNDNTTITSSDENNHGTHVAAIALGNGNNNKGSSGIAPNCRLMPIQASFGNGQFAMSDVVDGILYAIKHGAKVINLSLGVPFSDLEAFTPEQQERIASEFGLDQALFWNELFGIAEKEKVNIVIAAGNEDVLSGLDPLRRSNKAIKVAAIDSKFDKASFSNFFNHWTEENCFISAPGEKIYSAVPGNKYMYMDGTSMAAPIVSGAIGLLLSVNPELNPKDIMRILRETSGRVGSNKIPPRLLIDKAIILAQD